MTPIIISIAVALFSALAWAVVRGRRQRKHESKVANLGAWLTRKELTSNDAWQTPDGAWWTIDGRVGRKA